ncbi:hypothetical protein FOJ82_06860 [Tessaracoccus rhinocerotis]|uniref:IPT/TIG domain-containing protein n=1 Tax=Tessaracoccus rhinocerotis TaxID=1689449 RepID=A0A553K286_9ACTN|nr:hypothetical protein [Tessaracoccus rhinocerotis]TRY18826.1 hypothetical protein FOJ82_06860 [Tessaracoccus rhinocerotis]
MELIAVKSFVGRPTVLALVTVLAASASFVGAVQVATAAPVVVELAATEILPGGETSMTISGCSVGAELVVFDGSEQEGRSIVVADETLPMTVPVFHDSFPLAAGGRGVTVQVGADCLPAAGSQEAPTQSRQNVYVYGSWLTAEPEEFTVGSPVTFTAGDFPASSLVSVELYAAGGAELLFTSPLGTAREDRSVSGVVTFPAELECGTYALDVVSGDLFVAAELYICEEPEPTPTPTPTPSPSPTPTPSATSAATSTPAAAPEPSTSPTRTATATPSATSAATPAGQRRAMPGLPRTGN